jgi:glycosyltransferase involved in cell wall biosynthesis
MISVVVPVYNGSRYLKEAIESIVRQNFDMLEIIIVDDGSTDDTKQIVQSLPYTNLIYLYQENGGPSKARNSGIRAAKYDYIAFLDADDTWPLGKLHSQFSFLKNDSAVDVVTGLVKYVFAPGSEYRKKEYNVDDPIFNVQLGAMLVRKKIIDTIGYFNEQLRYSEDQDWLMRIRENNLSIHVLHEVTLYYRIHPGNMTRHKTAKELNLLQALKLSLDRRRKTGLDALPDYERQ